MCVICVFYTNLLAFGFAVPRLTAPRAHLCQSLILESLLPTKKHQKQNSSQDAAVETVTYILLAAVESPFRTV